MDINELQKRFAYHKVDFDKSDMMDEIRIMVLDLAILINDNCPESREKSLAITNLEQVMFWSNSAIARN